MGATDFFHQEFRTKRQSYGDLLRYCAVVSNGVVLGKGGELIASLRYRGQDLQCASPEERAQIGMRVNAALCRLGNGWMWHVTSSREESAAYRYSDHFPGAVSQAVENERRAQYQAEGMHFENDYVLTMTYVPPMLKGRLREHVFEEADDEKEKKKKLSKELIIAKKELEYFVRTVGDISAQLDTDLGGMQPMLARWEYDQRLKRKVRYDDQLSFLLWCATGVRQSVRLPVSVAPVGVDAMIGAQPFYTGIRPRVGNRFIRVVSIETPPEVGTDMGMLDILNCVPVAYRWTTRWIARDAATSRKIIEKAQSKWNQLTRPLLDQITGRNTPEHKMNTNAVQMSFDARTALNDLNSGGVAYGHYTSTIILMDEDQGKLEASVTGLVKLLRYSGYVVRDEDINCVEAFLGSIPGHGYENVRRPIMHSLNLAHLLPLSSVWQGPEGNACSFYQRYYGTDELPPPLFYGAASGGTPFRVVLHNGDVGHTLMIGPTGAGKSTGLGLMALSHFRYPNGKVFCFEKGESMFVACEAEGGNHFAFMSDEETKVIGLAPFARVDRPGERAWAADYLESILVLNDVKVTLDMRKDIRTSLELLATRPANMRSITDLIGLITTPDIRAVLGEYESALAGGMLNAREDSISLGRFSVFEMEELMKANDRHGAPVLLYLFRAIERALDGSPVMIILDEAWLMLKHPIFREKIEEWLKVLRKANAHVIFATQELEELSKSEIRATLFSACQTRILLPNAQAANEESSKVYKEIGLVRQEIEVIANAIPKREYFFTSPTGRRLFQLELGPVAKAFVATSGKDDKALARRLRDMHGKRWVGEYLREKGVNPAVLGGVWAANNGVGGVVAA